MAGKLGVVAGFFVPVTVEERVWGTRSTGSSGPSIPVGTEDRLTQFAELDAAAIANAENKAKLTACRARVVATADETDAACNATSTTAPSNAVQASPFGHLRAGGQELSRVVVRP